MNPNDIPSTIPSPPGNSYAKVTEVAAALNRHERTIRSYIRLLREDFGHPTSSKSSTAEHSTAGSNKYSPNSPSTKPKEHNTYSPNPRLPHGRL